MPGVVYQPERLNRPLASKEQGKEAAYTQYDKLMAGRQPIKDNAQLPLVLKAS
jgi:hypothetical protein